MQPANYSRYKGNRLLLSSSSIVAITINAD